MTKTTVKRVLFVLSILIISVVNISFAADFEGQKTFKEGKKHFNKERYNLALPYFLSLQRENPDNANLNYCVGMCYFHTSTMHDSCIYYLTQATKNKDVTLFYKNAYTSTMAPVKVYYYLGMAYFRNNMPETATRHLQHYRRFLDHPEVRPQKIAAEDVDLQIAVFENEKDYANQQRSLKTAVRDSLNNEIGFYKTNYEGTAQLLEMKNNEVIHLSQEVEAYNKTRNRPIGASTEVIPDKITAFTVQISALENDLPVSDFNKISGVKKCRMADGLYYYSTGTFTTREEAEVRCKEIRALGYPDAWVRPTFSCK